MKLKNYFVVLTFVVLVSVSQTGCDDGANANGKHGEDVKNGEVDEGLAEGEGLLDSAGNLMNKAKESGANGLNWIQDQVGNAAGSGAEMAGDTATWVNETFDSLKNRGLTTANNATDWVSEDFNNMGAWQYKVLTVAIADLADLETKLDELGKLKWECFHVATGENGDQIFYFKKSRRSYMKNLPLRDVLKMLPMSSGAD